VVVQHLEFLPQAGFRAPVLSMAVSAPALRNIIRENRFNQIENLQQAGKADGMFTFERYRQEFLEAKAKLTPPALAFRASGQAAPPILPAPEQPGLNLAQPPLAVPCEPAARPSPQAVRDLGGEAPEPYRIDDAVSLEELVAQMHAKTP
jgi:hypothetical protein